MLIDNAAIHSDECDDLARQYGILVLRLPPYSPDFAPVEGIFSDLKRWLASESVADRLGGLTMPNGELMGSNVRLMVEVGLASITTVQCAGQFERVYLEWLRHDEDFAGGEGGGGVEDGEMADEDGLFAE